MEEDDDEQPTLCEKIPQRYVVSALLCFVLTHIVFVRNIFLVQMKLVLDPIPAQTIVRTGKTIVCDNFKGHNITVTPKFPDMKYDKWTYKDFMDIFNCYYIIYIAFQPVVGYISDRFIHAPRLLIFGTVLSTTAYCFLSHLVILVSRNNPWPLKVSQFVLGLSNSFLFPVTATIMSHWIPSRERAFFFGLTFSGLFLGMALSESVIGPCIDYSEIWYLPTYLSGIVGLILLYGWYKYGYADPQHSRAIRKSEQSYLYMEMGDSITRKNKIVPLVKLFSNFNVWLTIMGNFGPEYFWFSVWWTIPKYHARAYLLVEEYTSTWHALPFAIGIFCPGILGFVSDWLVNNKYTDTITLRKFFTYIGTMGPPIYMMAETYAGCDMNLARTFMTIALCLQGFCYSGIKVLPLDFFPNYSGFLYGLTGLCNIALYLILYMESHLAVEGTLQQFRTLFMVCFGIEFYSNVWVILMGHVKKNEVKSA